jgi:hypothetical protein
MDSRNEYVRLIFKKFCQWGNRKIVEFEIPYKGGPVPLWANISVPYFQKLGGVSIIFFIICLAEYIVIDRFLKAP